MISKFVRRFSQSQHVLNLNSINPNLRDMEYAVRGLVPMTAEKIQQDLQQNAYSYPFDEVLFCNIGNPQSVGQQSLTFYREVTALCDNSKLLEKAGVEQLFDAYSIERARKSLEELRVGTGAYSHSQGIAPFRKHVAGFIQQRDGYECNPDDIFLTNGASSGIQMLLTAVLSTTTSGLMIPVPQYPIYSALTKLLNGQFVGYYLEENQSWGLNEEELENKIKQARNNNIDVKAIVVINPGNPIGNVLTYSDIETIIKFCEKEKLILIADEVYQENIYNEKKPFVSCKKVLRDIGSNVELASFHSTSKGFIGECGKRGGYMELVNFDPQAKAQLLKLASSGLCSNLIGQLLTSLMVNPPKSGTDSHERYVKERDDIMSSLNRKSKMVYNKLNSIPGISCQPLDGAMYAFPNLSFSQKFIQEAQKEGVHPDLKYSLSLLKKTGICAVPGSGFGQKPDSYHIRLTFLPPEEKLEQALEKFENHHLNL